MPWPSSPPSEPGAACWSAAATSAAARRSARSGGSGAVSATPRDRSRRLQRPLSERRRTPRRPAHPPGHPPQRLSALRRTTAQTALRRAPPPVNPLPFQPLPFQPLPFQPLCGPASAAPASAAPASAAPASDRNLYRHALGHRHQRIPLRRDLRHRHLRRTVHQRIVHQRIAWRTVRQRIVCRDPTSAGPDLCRTLRPTRLPLTNHHRRTRPPTPPPPAPHLRHRNLGEMSSANRRRTVRQRIVCRPNLAQAQTLPQPLPAPPPATTSSRGHALGCEGGDGEGRSLRAGTGARRRLDCAVRDARRSNRVRGRTRGRRSLLA